jgi:hypothetical protein
MKLWLEIFAVILVSLYWVSFINKAIDAGRELLAGFLILTGFTTVIWGVAHLVR